MGGGGVSEDSRVQSILFWRGNPLLPSHGMVK